MNAIGRPLIPISAELFQKYCELLLDQDTICNLFRCSYDTLERRCKAWYGVTFAEAYNYFAAPGKACLCAWQIKRARGRSGDGTDGSDKMLIWLGMQHLGQRAQATQRIEPAEPPNRALESQHINPALLDDDELEKLETILSKAQGEQCAIA